jgi:hypothetical protein
MKPRRATVFGSFFKKNTSGSTRVQENGYFSKGGILSKDSSYMNAKWNAELTKCIQQL